jgi:hypothetical protein
MTEIEYRSANGINKSALWEIRKSLRQHWCLEERAINSCCNLRHSATSTRWSRKSTGAQETARHSISYSWTEDEINAELG